MITKKLFVLFSTAATIAFLPFFVLASQPRELFIEPYAEPWAIFCLTVFFLSYLLVIAEEKTLLRKSKPVMLGASIIWVTIGIAAPKYGVDHEQLRAAIYHDLNGQWVEGPLARGVEIPSDREKGEG